MNIKSRFVLLPFLLGLILHAHSQDFSLPFLPNETWSCGQGNADDPAAPNVTHSANSSMEFAWDFNWGNGIEDQGKPCIAPRGGTVESMGYNESTCTRTDGSNYICGWGHWITIRFDDGVFGKFAHLNAQPIVREGEEIEQGQVIGFVGGTPAYSPHIHWQIQQDGRRDGISTPSGFQEINYTAPISNIREDSTEGVALEGHYYTSANTRLFENAYQATGSIPLSNFSWWKAWVTEDYDNVYYAGVIDGFQDGHVIYDPMRGARSAVHIYGALWLSWQTLGGPTSYLGAPIGPRYNWQGQTKQDFQGGYLALDGTTVTALDYQEIYSPGGFDYNASSDESDLLLQELPGSNNIGWSPVVSYLFAECYKRNGKAANLGNPHAGAVPGTSAAVHKWDFTNVNNEPDFHWVQNFENGSYGDCIIIYNPDNEAPDNSSAKNWKNEAYLISHEFWTHYRDNDGITELGFPINDAYPIGTYLDRQDFQYGYMVRSTMNTPADINVNEYGDYQVALTFNSPYVKVQSNPPGAALWEDTEFINTLPQITLYLPENESKDLTFKLNGYYDEDFTASWVDGGRTITIDLEPVSTGTGGTGGTHYDLNVIPGYLDFGLTTTQLSFTTEDGVSNATVYWDITTSQPWITVSTTSGTNDQEINVWIDRDGLSGFYEETITITSNAGTIQLPVFVDAFSTWSGTETFTFDDESALEDWLLIEGTPDSSGVENGELRLFNGGLYKNRSLSEAILTAPGSIFDSVSCTFTFDNGAQDISNQVTVVYVNWQDANHGYRWYIEEKTGSGLVKFQKIQPGQPDTETLWQQPMILPSGTYTVGYTNETNTFTFKDESGGSIINASVTDSTYTYGRIGFGVNEEETMIDNVMVSGHTPIVYRHSTFVQDQYALGVWDMNGILGSTEKKTNSVTNNLLTETGVSSEAGLNYTLDNAYGFDKASWSRLITDLDTELDGLAQLTIEGWFRFDNDGNNVLFGSWHGNENRLVLEWQGNNAPLYVFVASSPTDGGSNYGYTANLEREQDRWYYIALVYDGSGSNDDQKLKLYIDGVHVPFVAVPGSIPTALTTIGSSHPLIWGYYKDEAAGTSSLGGRISSARVSNCARSASDIAAVMDNEIRFSVTTTDISLTPANNTDSLIISSNGITSISKQANWLNLSTSSTQGMNQVVALTADSAGLSNGSYTDTLEIVGDDSTVSIPVMFAISSPGTGPFTVDGNTLGLWNMTGAVGSDGKRMNEATNALLTETGVGSTTGLDDITDGAYDFDKANWSRLLTNLDTELDGLSAFTYECWIQFDNPNNNVVMGRDNGSAFQLEWQSDGGKIYAFVGSSYAYTGGLSRTTGEWYYLALTYDGSQSGNSNRLKVYVNGNQETLSYSGTVPNSLPSSGNEPLIHGYYKDDDAGTSSLAGALSAVRVSDIARSATEISDHHSNTLGKRAVNGKEAGPKDGLPTIYKLYSAYPNPFNPATTIQCDLPKNSEVKLAIYNILGEQVKVLVNSMIEAGTHRIVWNGKDDNGSNVASGIYLYRLTTGEYRETKKMTLLR